WRARTRTLSNVNFATLPPASSDLAPRDSSPLSREDLTEVIELTLTTGQFLLEHGATSMRVEETMDLVSASLGVRKMDVLVSPNVIIVTTDDGQEFRTKARRVNRMHVQMA